MLNSFDIYSRYGHSVDLEDSFAWLFYLTQGVGGLAQAVWIMRKKHLGVKGK